MPKPITDAHPCHSIVSQEEPGSKLRLLAQLLVAASLGSVALLSGLVAWRLFPIEHSTSHAPAEKRAAVRSPVPPQVIPVEAEREPEAPCAALLAPLPEPDEERWPEEEKQPPSISQLKLPEAPPRLPDIEKDQVVEQRLQESEEELRGELLAVEKVGLLSDREVQNIRVAGRAPLEKAQAEARKQEQTARFYLETARMNVEAARTFLEEHRSSQDASRVYNEAVASYRETAASYRLIARPSCQIGPAELERIAYQTSLSLHQALRRAAVRAGLVLQSGPKCRLEPATADQMDRLSNELRDKRLVTVPGARLGIKDGGRRAKALETWCARQRLELLSATVPTLTQMLQTENEAVRRVLVRELTRIKGSEATTALAGRAIMDLSPAIRQAALDGLKSRPWQQYGPVLLRGLRYPWTPVADRAAVALRALGCREAIAGLVDLLDLPSPSAPFLDRQTNQYTVRELVRLNHFHNCLLCHAPSANKDDGLVRGLVPTPGEPLPSLYYKATSGDFARADITFLRQDFSVTLPDDAVAPWPREQRYDFLTRLRTLLPEEASRLSAVDRYPQRDAVLYALRGLTGTDGGDSSARWRELLGLSPTKPSGEKTRSVPEMIAVSRTATDPRR